MKTRKSKTLHNQGVYINSKLTDKERYKKVIVESYIRKKLSRKDAIKRLQISEVQFKRVLKRYKSEGDAGLKHKLTNQPSNHATSDKLINQVIKLYKTKYHDFSYVFASEKLLELDGIEVSDTNLRRWLLKNGVTAPQHKHKAYFKKRQPRSRFGELVQIDGTFHDWFEDGNMHCIIHFVDDATKTSLAMIFTGETTLGAMHVLKRWCELYGCPESLYMDKHSTYKIHDKNQKLALDEELAGQKEALTDFGKVCSKLGIKLIFANTAQAKGRVERRHAILQDRLVKELRLRNIKTIENANTYILEKNGFLDQINTKFTVSAADSGSACVWFTQTELERIFTIDERRIVKNDCTVFFNGKIYQLNRHAEASPKAVVIIKTDLRGIMSMYINNHKMSYQMIEKRIKLENAPSEFVRTTLTRSHYGRIGKRKSPWSNYNSGYISR